VAGAVRLASRLESIKPSATLAVTTRVAELRARGVEVIDFGAGEPDFDTPPRIRAAARRAIEAGETRYTEVGGTAALRRAIALKLRRVNHLDYRPEDTIATCGGKHALFEAFHALFDQGDEVIVPAPFWVSYRDMLVLSGATPRIVRASASRGFKLGADDLARAIGPRTRGLVLNSPANPTGAAYGRGELEALGRVLAAHPQVVVVTDDVYEMLNFAPERPPHLVALFPELKSRAVLVNSVSKTYAMTGWRLGYAAGPEPVIRAMATLQGQMTSNPSSIAQAAAVEALAGPQDEVAPMVAEFRARRDYVMSRLAELPGVRCVAPDGAFYAFPEVSDLFARRWQGTPLGDAAGVAGFLLDQGHVAVVSGDDFAAPEHVRISYAASREALARGFDAIARAVALLD